MKAKIWLLLAALGVAAMGCSERVDCDKLESRLNECKAEMGNALANSEIIGHVDESSRDMVARMAGDMVISPLVNECNSEEGKFEDAKEVNACLDKSGCEAFAECIVSHAEKSM